MIIFRKHRIEDGFHLIEIANSDDKDKSLLLSQSEIATIHGLFCLDYDFRLLEQRIERLEERAGLR